MSYENIEVQNRFEGTLREIILSSPPGNVLSMKMMDEILEELKNAENASDLKLIVFGSEGETFSFGASVEEHTPEQVEEMLPSFHDFMDRIISFPIPTLANVTGSCFGGAFEFVLGCDFIAADYGTSFGVPEIQLGVFPPPACILLPEKIDNNFASEMILTGNAFPAEVLSKKTGLINLLVESDELDEAVDKFFKEQIEPRSASSLRIAKEAATKSLIKSYRDNIKEIEDLYLEKLMKTEDAQEGIQSFLEERNPSWKNR